MSVIPISLIKTIYSPLVQSLQLLEKELLIINIKITCLLNPLRRSDEGKGRFFSSTDSATSFKNTYNIHICF